MVGLMKISKLIEILRSIEESEGDINLIADHYYDNCQCYLVKESKEADASPYWEKMGADSVISLDDE